MAPGTSDAAPTRSAPGRPAVAFDDVLKVSVDLGFEGIQFHDDDVPDLENLSPPKIVTEAEVMRRKLDGRRHAPDPRCRP